MPRGELSSRLIVHNSFREGKGVYVPYLHKSASADPESPKSLMDMVSLDSEADSEALKLDAWGIPTPSEDSVAERKRCLGRIEGGRDERDDLDLIVMPGVAFDETLARLGHGKGFYDLFLQRYQSQIDSRADQTKMPFLGKYFQFSMPHNQGFD